MHSSAIFKGYALYKIDVKYGEATELYSPFATNVFSEFLLVLFRDMLLIFFIVWFFLSMHTILFCHCASVWDSIMHLGILRIFFLPRLAHI